MEKITITIPDNLTPQEEAIAIAKHIGKKLLPSTGNKMLGNVYEVKHLETQIIIKREPVEKPIVTMVCSVCQAIFEKKIGKRLFTNYGGTVRSLLYCSDKCRKAVADIAGPGRCSHTKKDLKPVRSWH